MDYSKEVEELKQKLRGVSWKMKSIKEKIPKEFGKQIGTISIEEVKKIIPNNWLDSIFDELGWREKDIFVPKDIEEFCLKLLKRLEKWVREEE